MDYKLIIFVRCTLSTSPVKTRMKIPCFYGLIYRKNNINYTRIKLGNHCWFTQ